MANVANPVWTLISLLNVFNVHGVYEHYCEFGLCENEQYCCGNNNCCTKTLDLWFFWAGILLVTFALAVAAGMRYTRSRDPTYVPVATEPSEDVQVSMEAFK
ncbi:hypothetical protein FQA39_LY07839 [Lamprigera yunnana]|nr:hypothetical protein FQA39_LY07839 [Lamprigera yunnana]